MTLEEDSVDIFGGASGAAVPFRNMVEQSRWVTITQEDPTHSERYIERFRSMDAEGTDLAGEARLIDAMAARGSRILDAGCGPGRVAGRLHGAGHEVVGVDVDPVLIAAAQTDHPGPRWVVADLAELSLGETFDLIVSAGNVVAFLAPSTRQLVLARLREHLAPGGRLVIGFGAGRDYEFADFFDQVDEAGLTVDARFSTWDLRPFDSESEFLVVVLSA